MTIIQTAVPTIASVNEELTELGLDDDTITRLSAHFRMIKRLIDVDAGTCGYISVDMDIHDALDGIMPDLAYAAPGSLHERVNQAYLPAGWTFFHDKHLYCSLEAVQYP